MEGVFRRRSCRRSGEWRPAAAARNRGLGRSGTPPARHDDLAARSIAVRIRRQCRRWKRGPRPKIATVERREASVPRHGTRRASLARIKSRLANATTDIVRLSALRPPLFGFLGGWTRKKKRGPERTKMRRGNEMCCAAEAAERAV